MFNDFGSDLSRGDAVARLVYECVFLSDDGLGYSDNEDVCFVEYLKDSSLQYAGADIVVFPGENRECLVEVKSAVDSAGPRAKSGLPLGTFAHELLYRNDKHEVKPGWFVDTRKRSDVYLYCWIPVVRRELQREPGASYYRIREIGDIGVLEVAIVEVRRLLEYIDRGLFGGESEHPEAVIKDALLTKAKQVRASGRQSNRIGKFRAIFSKSLKEEPVNLLIPKKDLRELAFHAFKIKQMTYSSDPARIEWAVTRWDD